MGSHRHGAPVNEPAPRSAPLRVVVADDQATVRDGLVVLLSLADGIEVSRAWLDNGLLHIELVRKEIESRVRVIEISPQTRR